MQALAAASQMMAMQGAQGMPVMGSGTPPAPLQRDFNSMQSLHSMDSGGSEAGLRSPQLSGVHFADRMSLSALQRMPEQNGDLEKGCLCSDE